MKQRCFNANHTAYASYGGRGITVCDRWVKSFAAFYQDMGERPDGLTLERINNDGPYELNNCRWASRQEQMLNRRNVREVTIEGEKYKAHILSQLSGLKTDTIIERAQQGLTLEQVLDPSRRIFYAGLAMTPYRRDNTHCRRGHLYTDESTYWTPAGYRQCRICNGERQRISRHKIS
jgi:hypothetical protein